jgi:hypothetical protein
MGRLGIVALLLMLFGSFAFADVPQVANDYINIFVDLLKGNAGIFFAAVILGFSGFLAWRNGNLTPILWGLAGAVLVVGGPYIAPKLMDFAKNLWG